MFRIQFHLIHRLSFKLPLVYSPFPKKDSPSADFSPFYPSATSSTIITRNPATKPQVPARL